jgi:HEAT repeat protein
MAMRAAEARKIFEAFLDEPSEDVDLGPAMAAAVGFSEEEDLALFCEVLRFSPEAAVIGPLWKRVGDSSLTPGARVQALRCISAVLYHAAQELADGEGDDKLLDVARFETEVQRLYDTSQKKANPDELRRQALETVAELTEDEALEDVRKRGRRAFESDDGMWAATGLLVLRKTDPDKAPGLIRKALKHKDPNVRYEAIRGLAEMGRPEDIRELESYVFDGEGEDQFIAIYALASVPGDEAGAILRDAREWLSGDALDAAREAYLRWDEYWRIREAEEVEDQSSFKIYKVGRRFFMADDDVGGDTD